MYGCDGQYSKITNCTVANNTATLGSGGGLYDCSGTVTNSIIWGNTDGDEDTLTQQEQIGGIAIPSSVSYSCVQDGTIDGTAYLGTNNVDGDPSFANVALGDYKIGYDSSCVDKGLDSAVPSYITKDTTGESRGVDGDHIITSPDSDAVTVDIGAYELPRIWYVKKDSTGTSGISWEVDKAFGELHAALSYLSTLDPSERTGEVWVSQGTYTPDPASPSNSFNMIENVNIFGGFDGTETVREDRDIAAKETILSGDIGVTNLRSDNVYHVVAGENCNIDGFTITNGYAKGDGTGEDVGAGIYHIKPAGPNGEKLVIRNCYVRHNRSVGDGAGVYVGDTAGFMAVNTVFDGNWTSGTGGAVFSAGVVSDALVLTNCTIHGNKSVTVDGCGGVKAEGTPTITNSILWGNINKNINNEDTHSNENVQLQAGNTDNVMWCHIEDEFSDDADLPFGIIDQNISDDAPMFTQEGIWEWRQPDESEMSGTFILDQNNGLKIFDLDDQNPDFKTSAPSTTCDPGIVSQYLDTTFPALRIPSYADGSAGTTSGITHFDLWFREDDSQNGINTNVEVEIELTEVQGTVGLYGLDKTDWYPINGLGFGNEGRDNNYHFTVQYHGEVTYFPGQVLTFNGSDDIFVYVEGKLEIDLGGIYVDETSPVTGCGHNHDNEIVMDELAETYGWKEGDQFKLDLFFAQRHVDGDGNPADDSVLKMAIPVHMEPYFVAGDYHLQSDSPCVDSGLDSTVDELSCTDIDGGDRVKGPAVDMGAYEYGWPTADAGFDAAGVYTDTELSFDLDGTAGGYSPSYLWTCVSGPTAYSVPNPSSEDTTVLLDTLGLYVFKFEVTDGLHTANDLVAVDVMNYQPIAIDESYSVHWFGSTLTDNVLSNDINPESDGLDVIQIGSLSGDGTLNSFNTDTGSFTYTPSGTSIGIATFTYQSYDSYGQYSNEATVKINVTNTPPLVYAISNDDVNEGVEITIDLKDIQYATDPDGDALTYSKIGNLPDGATLKNGVFSWTPGYDQAGVYEVNFSVSDTIDSVNWLPVTITVNNVNEPPQLNPISNAGVYKNELLTFTVTATDDDTGLTYSVDSEPAGNLPQGAQINVSTGEFSWTPTNDQYGPHQLRFTVTDVGGLTDFQVMQINVIDRAPSIDLITPKTVYVGQTVSFEVSATDPDDDELIYSCTNLPSSGAYFDANNSNIFTWTPDCGDVDIPGSPHTFSFTATEVEQPQLSIGVIGTITVISVQTVDAGENQYRELASATNEAGYTVTLDGTGVCDETNVVYMWSIVNKPILANVNFSPATSPDTGLAFAAGHDICQGDYVLKLSAYQDLDGSTTFSPGDELLDADTVTVSIRFGNLAPVVDAGNYQKAFIEVPVHLTGKVSDDGLPEQPGYITSTWSSVPATAVFTDLSSPITTVTFPASGRYELTLTANDGLLTGFGTVIIDVTSANSPPVINAGADTSIVLPAIVKLDRATCDDDGWPVPPGVTTHSWTVETAIDPDGGNIDISSVSFSDKTELNSWVTFPEKGTYTLKLKATDDDGVTYVEDEVMITVKPAIKLAAGETNSFVLMDNGEDDGDKFDQYLWACGSNYYGSLGIGEELYSHVVGGMWGEYINHDRKMLTRVVKGTQGTTWPENIVVNDNPNAVSDSPIVDIIGIDGGGIHTIAFDDTGKAYCWGFNEFGQIGIGSNQYKPTPRWVDLSGVTAVAAGRSGSHSLAVDGNGEVWAWGWNSKGQLGYGNSYYPNIVSSDKYKSSPVQVQQTGGGNLSGITAVTAGQSSSFALDNTGNVWSWGGNQPSSSGVWDENWDGYGVLGIGRSDNHYQATAVMVLKGAQVLSYEHLEGIASISAGWGHCMALEEIDPDNDQRNGRVYTWGTNESELGAEPGGRLGNGESSGSKSSPVLVLTSDGQPLENIVAISAGEGHCMALQKYDPENGFDGIVYTWGANQVGQLGISDVYESSFYATPVHYPDLDGDGSSDVTGGVLQNIVSIAAGYWHCIAADVNGNLWSWGYGGSGALGNPGFNRSYVPIPMLSPEMNNRVQNITPGRLEAGKDIWYDDINLAMDGADPGDEIVVYPGVHKIDKPISRSCYYDYPDGILESAGYNFTIRSVNPDDENIVRNTIIVPEGGAQNFIFINGLCPQYTSFVEYPHDILINISGLTLKSFNDTAVKVNFVPLASRESKVYIDKCVIEACDNALSFNIAAGWGDSGGGSAEVYITNNLFKNNSGFGIDLDVSASDVWNAKFEINNNGIDNSSMPVNATGIRINDENVSDLIYIKNNLIISSTTITLMNSKADFTIRNNTLVSLDVGHYCDGFKIDSDTNGDADLDISNNIFWAPDDDDGYDDTWAITDDCTVGYSYVGNAGHESYGYRTVKDAYYETYFPEYIDAEFSNLYVNPTAQLPDSSSYPYPTGVPEPGFVFQTVDTGLYAHWPMDDPDNGTIPKFADDVVGSKVANIYPRTWDSDTASVIVYGDPWSRGGEEATGYYLPAMMGDSLYLGGVNNYHARISDAGITGNNTRSFALWTHIKSYGPILSWGDNDDGSSVAGAKWEFGITNPEDTDADGAMKLYVNVGSGRLVGSTELSPLGWYHVAAVFEGTNLSDVKLYVNGKLEQAEYDNDQLINTATGTMFYIGRDRQDYGNETYYTGMVDDVRIYSRSLTSNELRHLAGDKDVKYSLGYNSLCIDKGDEVPDYFLENDIEGKVRFQGGRVDMGAFETGDFEISAGIDKRVSSVPLEGDWPTVTLSDATCSEDGSDGITYRWEWVSSPGDTPAPSDVSISSSTDLNPSVDLKADVVGNYVLKLTVREEITEGVFIDVVSDTLTITVYPDVDAGPDQMLFQDYDTVLNGTVPVGYDIQWTGPNGVTFGDSTDIDTMITLPSGKTGSYTLQLDSVHDGQVIDSDTVVITVSTQPDQLPVIEAVGGVRLDILEEDVSVSTDLWAWIIDESPSIMSDSYITWSCDDEHVSLGEPSYEGELAMIGVTVSDPGTFAVYPVTITVSEPTSDTIVEHIINLYVYPPVTTELIVGDYESVTLVDVKGVDTAFLPLDQVLFDSDADQLTYYWEAADSQGNPRPDVSFVTYGSSEFNAFDTVAIFIAAGEYKLTLTVFSFDTEIASDSTVVVVNEVDATDPVIDSFTATDSDGTDVNGSPEVAGQVDLTIEASDPESRIQTVELWLDDGENDSYVLKSYPDTENFYYSLYSRSKSLTITHDFSTYGYAHGQTLEFTAKVINYSGLEETATLSFTVIDPTGGVPPAAAITGISPSQLENYQTIITEGFCTLSGYAYHSDVTVTYDIDLYKSEVTIYGNSSWAYSDGYLVKNLIQNASSSSKSEIELGELDLTGVADGAYQLLLTVDASGSKSYANIGFVLDCPLKIGQVKFSQEDLMVPIGGVPIRVIRTYDSFNRKDDSEFGYGWDYAIATMEIELNEERELMFVDEQLGSGTEDRFVRSGSNYSRDVTLTMPDGNKATFRFKLEEHNDNDTGLFPVYAAMYDSPLGVNATLVTLQDYEDENDGYGEVLKLTLIDNPKTPETDNILLWGGQGLGYAGFEDPANYDFSGYVLLMEDGTKYFFEREDYGGDTFDQGGLPYYAAPKGPLYLSKIETASGERVDFVTDAEYADNSNPNNVDRTINAIKSGYMNGDGELDDTAKSIKIVYEGNHISKIYPPSEMSDDSLISGAVPYVKYGYDENSNLITVKKLIDRSTTEYETMTVSYDGDGHDPADHYVTNIIDERGLSPIRYLYEDGLLVGTMDAKGNTISITHDTAANSEIVYDRNDVLRENPTFYVYDDRGNVLEVRKQVGEEVVSLTEYDYDCPDYPDKPTQVTTEVPDYSAPGTVVNSVTEYEYENHHEQDCEGGDCECEQWLQKQTVIGPGPAYSLTKTIYDEHGNVIEIIQGENASTFDNYDIVSTTRNYYTTDNLLYLTGVATGVSGSYDWHSISVTLYDSNNRVLKVVQFDFDSDPTSHVFSDSQTGMAKAYDIVKTKEWSNIVSQYIYFANTSDDGYSPDQPKSVTGADGRSTYFYYDENNAQKASWYVWNDPAGELASKTVLNVNETDAQGRSICSARIVENSTPDIEDLMAGVDDYIASHDGETGFESLVQGDTKYNSIGKVDYDIDINGVVTKYGYDETGNLVETLVYLSWDDYNNNYPAYDPANPSTYTAINSISRTLYDAEGRTLVTVGPYDPSDVNTEPIGSETVYDALGRVEETRRWANVGINFDRDVVADGVISIVSDKVAANAGTADLAWTSEGAQPILGNEISHSRSVYDVAGRVKMSITQDTNGDEQPTSYEYDLAGRQTAVIDPLGHDIVRIAGRIDTATLKNPASHRSETYYDGSRRDYVVDANGHTTRFEYDALGRATSTEYEPTVVVEGGADAVPTYTHVGYDVLGRKAWDAEQTIETHAAIKASLDTKAKQYSYDTAGRLIKVKLPQVEDPDNDNDDTNPLYDYYYDDYGNQIAQLDPRSRITVFKYDHMSRQTHKYMPFAITQAELDDIFDVTGGSDEFSMAYELYDLTDTIAPARQYTYYDDRGRVKVQLDYKEQAVGYFFDSLGRLQYRCYYVADDTIDGANENYDEATPDIGYAERVEYTYDALGRQKTITDLNGTTTYYYDEQGRAHVISSPQGVIGYLYDPITGGKIRTRSYFIGTSYADIKAGTGPIADTTYGYDEMGRLDDVGSNTGNVSYTYTEVGSRESVTLPNGAYTWYNYNEQNRLVDVKNFKAFEPDPMPDIPTVVNTLSKFNYPLKANGMRAGVDEYLSNVGSGETRNIDYMYDALNRLTDETAVVGSHGYDTDYTYDLAGNRKLRHVKVTNSDDTYDLYTRYTHDAATDRLELEEHSSAPFAALPWSGDGHVYAFANTGGGISYQLPGSDTRLGQLGAFFVGLPSVVNGYLLYVGLAVLGIILLWPVISGVLCRFKYGVWPRRRLRWLIVRNTICVLMVFIFLFGPECFLNLSDAAVQYSNLSETAWGKAGDVFSYEYDANGSLTYKLYGNYDLTADTAENYIAANSALEYEKHEYNLQGRLAKLTEYRVDEYYHDDGTADDTVTTVTDYIYNTGGIRVGKEVAVTVNGIVEEHTNTDYMIDPSNHTGYAQVLWDYEYNHGNYESYISYIPYVIGDDVIGQNVEEANMQYMLYDGHGSTRQLLNADKSIADSYSYDGYGVMLGSGANAADNAQTSMLYAGEQYDSNAGMYYNRARYYNPSNGLFNRVDPYAGNTQDPQSLHKYAYCHGNPINSIDPTGMMSYVEISVVLGVTAFIGGIIMGPLHNAIEQNREASMLAFQADAVSFLSDGLRTQMERDFLGLSDPDLRGMKEAFYRDLGNGQRVVTYQSHQAKASLLQGIDNSFHTAQIGSMVLGVTAGMTKVVWSKQHGIDSHWETIVKNVTNRMGKDDILEVYTNRSISTATKHRNSCRLMPDWTEVTKSGKVRVYEVISPSQSPDEFVRKGLKYQQALGDMLEDYQVINIGGQIP